MEALKDIAAADNQKLIMMPLEASGVIGSIAGVAKGQAGAAGWR